MGVLKLVGGGLWGLGWGKKKFLSFESKFFVGC